MVETVLDHITAMNVPKMLRVIISPFSAEETLGYVKKLFENHPEESIDIVIEEFLPILANIQRTTGNDSFDCVKKCRPN